MNTHRVFARRSGAGLLAVLAAGLCSQALAAEEVLALATPAVIEVQARPSSLQAELNEYVRSVNAQMKTSLENSFKQRPAPTLQIAGVESSTRG